MNTNGNKEWRTFFLLRKNTSQIDKNPLYDGLTFTMGKVAILYDGLTFTMGKVTILYDGLIFTMGKSQTL